MTISRRKFLKLFGLGTLGTLFTSGIWFSRAHADNIYYSGPPSDHFDGRTFFNPRGVQPRSFSQFLKWKLLERPHKWPDSYTSEFHGSQPAQHVHGESITVTMIGHATLLIQVNGLNIITDPVFSDRASPFQIVGPMRVNPPGIEFSDLPKIDAVLLTHNHYDHLDVLTLEKLYRRDNPVIVTPLGNDTIINNVFSGANIRTGDWHDKFDISGDTKIHFEPCHHWSARGTRDRRMALWAAFVIETPTRKIFHIGDTGFHGGKPYIDAAEKHGGFDLAIIPVGAYEPRWFMKGQHQNPSEAVEGFKLCRTRYAIGHHWGTFQLTNEPIEEPIELLARALEENGVDPDRFQPLAPGQVWKRELA